MQEIIIDLAISADEYIKQYQSPGINVVTKSIDGRRVRLPANILRRYVTREGILGRFRISFTDTGQYHAIEKL